VRATIVGEFVGTDPRIAAFSRRVWAMADFLTSRGWEVRLLAPQIPSNSILSPGANSALLERVPSYSFWRSVVGSPLGVFLLPRTIMGFCKRFHSFGSDLVIVSASNPFILFETLIAARLVTIPIVFDVQDSWLLAYSVYPGRVRNLMRRILEGFALRRGAVVVAVTAGQTLLIKQGYRLDSVRTMTIPNGTSLRPQRRAEFESRYDLIHAGPPRSYYDTVGLLDALAILLRRGKPYVIAFLGISAGQETERWRDEVARRGLSDWVRFLPPVPFADIPEALAKGRIGVVTMGSNPGFKAAISTKSFDYLAAGLPILYLGPKDSEQAALVERFGIGAAADNPIQFADACQHILSDEGLQAALRTRVAAAAARFDWNILFEPLHRELVQLVNPKASTTKGPKANAT
jgi:glycosyltransferase involved in cell wall biosynthesis